MIIAKVPILYRGKQYDTGQELPADDLEMVNLWEKAGTIVKIPAENEEVAPVQPETTSMRVSKTKATRETAEAGLEGMAINGETEENLVGKVPKTPARKKK